MIYGLDLRTAGLALGAILLLGHLAALVRPDTAIRLARDFPRSRIAATILIALAAIWSFLLVRSIDLGEFTPLRTPMLVGIIAGTILSWLLVQEFLAVRALGILLLLAAEPLLESAVLRGEPTRLLVVLPAYAWVFAGLFLVGMPYLLRDAIALASASRPRWLAAAAAGTAYAIVLLACAILWW
jgi:hypothetical protein